MVHIPYVGKISLYINKEINKTKFVCLFLHFSMPLKKETPRVGKMAQQIKVFVAKLDDLSSIPQRHRVKRASLLM